VGNFAAMPAHAASGRRRRAVAYSLAGILAVAALLFGGPQAARALGRSGASLSGASASVGAFETPAASPSPSPSATPNGPYRVVGLGDSVPAGSACGCTSYVSLVGRYEAGRLDTSADVSNLARGGLTTSGLLGQLGEASVRRSIASADLVVITVGANDFDTGRVADDACRGPALSCFRSTLRTQAAQLDEVLDRVDALIGSRATVLMTGYWNVFLDGDVAAARGSDYVANSVALTRAENAQIAAAARDHGATYVDIFTPFKGASGTANDTSLLAADGDHPNAAGHRKIAEALEAALAGRLG
jgi:lysophospholipase L1-like esterase